MLQPRLIFGCPFGNYIHKPYATSTLGTFTLAARPGRLGQILRTVRYSATMDAWVNKIGLRNPGFDSLIDVREVPKDYSDKIISIHGFNTAEWLEFIETKIHLLPTHQGKRQCWELNLSRPNVTDKPLDYDRIFASVKVMQNSTHNDFIIKLPPIQWHKIFEAAAFNNLRNFHCCNTLPTHRGGMSGAPLKMYSLNVIREIRKVYGGNLMLIGGGGIRTQNDISEYADAGANKVAIASTLFNPMTHLFRLKSLAKFADFVLK